MEGQTRVDLRSELGGALERLRLFAEQSPASGADVVELRRRYLRVEATLDFFADALASRNTDHRGELLRGLDQVAVASMRPALDLRGRPTPPVLTFIDKGVGAAILKAGLRLWEPGVENPVAAIKIARHNLLRPTALLHEVGHQVAHQVGWNEELRTALRSIDSSTGELWGSWASEIAADAFAFVHAGYPSVVALHDVIDGGDRTVFAFHGGPHPVGWLRLLLGVEFCRAVFGTGSWDELELDWLARYPSARSTEPALLERLRADAAAVAALVLKKPLGAFGGRGLVDVVDPSLVSPPALLSLAPPSVATLAASDPVPLVALAASRALRNPSQAYAEFEGWMVSLGRLSKLTTDEETS